MATKIKKEKLPNELEQNVTKVTKHNLVVPSKQIIKGLTSPFSAPGQQALTAPAAPNNLLGVCSIQDFSGNFGNHNSDLHQTHNDARGFYTYLYNWYTANFWYIDGAVQSWLYEEPYDHWQNYYGVDAVCIFYHSGHGNMTNTGVFQAPMGGKWNNETWFFSNNKALFGNQRIRYIFWSTCLSCRVGGGLTPITTWWAHDSNPGFRILFGFETTSIDSGDYGKNFWNHWKNGESFTTAWLNASWDITSHQGPTAVASGATQAEATNILFNERIFNWSAVGRNWYQWRWYTAASMAARNKALPKKLLVAELAPETFSQDHVHEIAKAIGLKNPATAMSKDGMFSIGANDKTIGLDRYGHLHIKLGTVNYNNKKKLDEKEAIRLAEEHIKKHNLHAGEQVQFDLIRLGKTAGGNTKDKAHKEEGYVTDTTVQFKQVINGVPVVNNNQGAIRVTVDNDGTVTHLQSSVKKVANLSPLSKSMAVNPKDNGAAAPLSQDAIEKSFKQQLKTYGPARLIAESEEVGYDLDNMHGRLVTQRIYEVTFEEGLKKLVKVIVPVFE